MYENLHRVEKAIFDILAVVFVLFYSYSAVVQPAATQFHRGVYVFITYVLVFLLHRSKTWYLRIWDYVLMALSMVTVIYWMVNFEAIAYRAGAETSMDMFVGVVGCSSALKSREGSWARCS